MPLCVYDPSRSAWQLRCTERVFRPALFLCVLGFFSIFLLLVSMGAR